MIFGKDRFQTILERRDAGSIPRPISVAMRESVAYSAFASAFFRAFFWRRGRRDLFFFASFGTFTEGCLGTPTAAATLPAAVPIALAAATRVLSAACSSCCSFFFAMPRYCNRFTRRDRPQKGLVLIV